MGGHSDEMVCFEREKDGSLLIGPQSGEAPHVTQITAHVSLFFADITWVLI